MAWVDELKKISNTSKYFKWYSNIIATAKNRHMLSDNKEIHHIVPRSLGGDNSMDNLVSLTVREHLLCHVLLCKMTSGQSKYKMLHAINLMAKASDDKSINMVVIRTLREQRRAAMIGEGNPNFGKHPSEETKIKIGNAMRGKKHSKDTLSLMSSKQRGNLNPMFMNKHSEDAIHRMKLKQKENRSIKFVCNHCGKSIDRQNYTRWHGDNCKTIKD